MRTTTRTLFPCLLLGLLCCSRCPTWADVTVKRLAPGVTLTQEINKATPLVINVLQVDLDAPGVRLGVGVGQDHISGTDPTHGREDVSRYARRHHVLAAVNADFFPYTGDPLGVGVKDGELFSEPWTGGGRAGPRVAMGVSADGRHVAFENLDFLGDLQSEDGQRVVLSGIDRAVNAGEVVVYTTFYGPLAGVRPGGVQVVVSPANLPVRASKLVVGRVQQVLVGAGAPAAIPSDGFVLSGAPGAGADFLAQHVHPGERIGFTLAVAPAGSVAAALRIASLPRIAGDLPSRAGAGLSRPAYFWAQVSQAVGGGPRLLTAGQVTVDGVAEGFDAGFTDHTNPRTAVGTSRDGRHLIVVTVDGRQVISKGVTLTDLALIIKRYGAWDAINFDGGGSTCLSVAGLVINSPEGTGQERPVADMLLVDSDRPDLRQSENAPEANPSEAQIAVPAGPVTVGEAAPLKVSAGGKLIGSAPRLLWQGMVTGGVGFVNQQGYFIPLKPGTGMVTALFRGRLLTAPITVQAKAPAAPLFALHADFAPDPQGAANRSELTVRILDQNGQLLAGAAVRLDVTGGTADTATLTTDPDGQATVGVTWDGPFGGSVHLQSGALAPVTIPQPGSAGKETMP